MRKPGLLLVCLLCAGHGRRVRESTPEHEVTESKEPSRALTNLLLASNPEAGFHPSGPGQHGPVGKKNVASSRPAISNPLQRQVEKLTSSLSAGALAAAIALTSNPDFAAAEELVSQFAKVDKTGPVGAAASIIEDGIDFVHNSLMNTGLVNTYGISIVLFTILIRTSLLPLVITQLTSSAKMQQLAPLQQKINEAFPKPAEAAQKNQYLAQLYQTANVNPIAGCLPAFAQIPVFLSLYRALSNLEGGQKLNEPFLWIPNLEGPVYGAPPGKTLEWVQSIFSGSPKLGWEDTLAYLSIPLILIISQSISFRILAPTKDPESMSDQEAQTQQIVRFLPFFVAFFALNVPSGLSLYWTVSNILATTFNFLVKSSIKEEGLGPEAEKIMEKIDIKLAQKPPQFTPIAQGAETKRPRKKKITYVIDTGKADSGTATGTATAPIEVEATAVPEGSVQEKTKKKKKSKASKKKSRK
mmetsp:Transcript_150145/g.279972  ORF Transcript_150145/g.279972 Transcript_150145/m.279972 type:complete len:470 (-) Transcript_150145:71-1480(-)